MAAPNTSVSLPSRLLDLVDQGLVIFDRDYRVTFWNRRMELATGLSRGHMIGAAAFSEVEGFMDKGIGALLAKAFAGEVVESGLIRYHIPRTGNKGYRRARFLPLMEDDTKSSQSSEVSTVAVIVTFVEGQPSLDEDDTPQVVTMLARGLAERLSSQLGVILGYTQVLKGDLSSVPSKDSTWAERTLGVIEEATRKAFEINKALFTFARQRSESQEEHLFLQDLFAYTIDSFLLTQGNGVHIELKADKALPHVLGNEAELCEVFVQLLRNAYEAVEGCEGPCINVHLGRVDRPSQAGQDESDAPATPWLQVVVSDNGPGIPRDLRREVLRPFYTTRGRHRMGLGLNMVETTLKSHGGFMRLDNNPDGGTQVALFFPALT